MQITDEAVEAAAQRLFVDQDGEFVQPGNPWLTTFEGSRRPKYIRRARLALEAALPHLAPQHPPRCWCGGGVGPRDPGDVTGVGCLANVMHDWRADWGTDWDQGAYEAAVAMGMPRLPGDQLVPAPQPVVDREAVGNAIEQAASDVDLAKYFLPGTTDHFTDAVLALLNGTAK